MPDPTPEELAWVEAAVAAAQVVAASVATARLIVSLGAAAPLTPDSLAAWYAEVRRTAEADQAAALDRLRAAAERLQAAGDRPGFGLLVAVLSRAVAGEVV